MTLVFCFLLAMAEFTPPSEAEAAKVLRECKNILPSTIEVSGRIIVRNKRGIVKSEHQYKIKRVSSKVESLTLDGKVIHAPKDFSQPIIDGSALTWSDLTLDYLTWEKSYYSTEKEDESVHGQKCIVIIAEKDSRTVKLWIDKKTSALLQAEERNGQSVRRLWGTRLKKFGDKFSVSVMEVELLGSGLRTKITVEEINE
jgi:hypothetical protein